MQDGCRLQPCKSRKQALCVFAVGWKTLVFQNPALIAFQMRPYIRRVLKSSSRECIWVFFHVRRQPLLQSGARWTFTRATAAPLSCSSQLKYHVCLSLERIYSADSLAGTPATPEGIRFSLYLSASFFLLWKSGLLCDTAGKLPFPSLSSPVKWDYSEEKKPETEDTGHNRAVIHRNLVPPLMRFAFNYKIGYYIE